MQKTCCRVDIEARSDDNEEVGTLRFGNGGLNHRHTLTEKHDEGALQTAILGTRTRHHIAVLGRQFLDTLGVVRVATLAHFGQFAMQMNHLFAARPLVKVVYILRDNRHFVIVLQRRNEPMSLIGHSCP